MRAPDGRLPPQEIKRLTENPDRCEELINALIEAWECAAEPPIPTIEEADPEYEMWLQIQIDQNWAAIARAMNLPTRTELRQGHIEVAISSKNDRWLNELLTRYPELVPFALSVLKRKRPHGRQENDCRNLEPYMRDLMAETHRYARLVRAACWHLLGKRNPPKPLTVIGPKPLTVIGIACKFKGVDEDQYLNWCKNRAKYRRRQNCAS